jgi:hypothetical protein
LLLHLGYRHLLAVSLLQQPNRDAAVSLLQRLASWTVLNARELRERGRALGVVPVGDGRTREAWRLGYKAARGAAQRAVAVAAVAAAEALALAESAAAAGAEAVAELRRQGFSVSARGRVRRFAPSGGWQTTAEAVARRVVENEQVDAVDDEEVVREEATSVTRRRTLQVR